MDPRYEKFIKKAEKKPSKKTMGDSLPGMEPAEFVYKPEENTGLTGEPKSFYQIQRECGNASWLKQNHPAARASFNVFNLELHPDRPMATGLAVVTVKGTSFPDKRDAVLAVAKALAAGTSTGEVELVPEPNNAFDPDALAIIDLATKAHIGYVPKAAGANRTYRLATEAGRLCGAYLIEAKQTTYKGEPSAILMLATGWIEA